MQSTTMQDSIRLDAWRNVFQKTNRILSEEKVNVNIVDRPDTVGMADVPAWSDGLDIFLSGPKVKEMLASNDKLAAVLRLKGLNYHELCHVLYTPRMNDELCRRLVEKVKQTGDNMWWYAFNALEDQRIETWFTSTYNASRRYFEATVLEWIIKNGSAESAVLIYGRKYLTPKIRVQSGRVFRKRYSDELYREFQTIIDNYLSLVLPADSIKAMSLIQDFVELLKKMQAMHGAPLPMLIINDNGGDTCPNQGDQGIARKGRVLVAPARAAAQRAGEVIEDAIDADLAEESAGDAERAAGAGEGQGSGTKPSEKGGEEGGGTASSGSGSDPSDGDAQGDKQKGSSPEAGQGSGGGGAGDTGTADHRVDSVSDAEALRQEMDGLLEDAYNNLDEVKDDEWVQNDVDNVLDAVKAAVENGKMNAAGKAAGGAKVAPTNGANMAVRRVHDILSRIRQEAEPETLRGQAHGRLDPRRFVARKKHEINIFKSWDSGNEEETGVEAVIIVDVSGSMSGSLPAAAAAMWALKRAFDKLSIRTTVLMFDTDHEVMYQPSEKAQASGVPVLRPGGGTDPTSALYQAERILWKSSAPNKVLITVTDGGWGGDENKRLAQMKRMHRQGVVSMLLGLDRSMSSYGKHGHLEGHDISNISELPKVASKLVATIMRNAIYN